MPEDLAVGDVMTRGVICIDANDTVQKAAEIMRKNSISSVIVTKKGDGVGIVTERDIISKIVAESKDPKRVKISDVMTSPLITINPESTIDDAAAIMRDRDIRRLVVTRKGKIIGVISEFDIVKVEPTLHTLIQEKSKWEISSAYAASEGAVTGICEVCGEYSETLRSVEGRMTCEECIPSS
ncbi:MAG: CBS domain-containing protein [Candidatus Altiarchaeota archaeon]|nr:CBS domain-containing protein [Candidatus Altiarchaeota archaeon]